ncbi:N-acetylglucosamine-6-phosphate deacetylase [Pseudonocardia sp. CA-107938]|uniref:N-acetylglucosamine-6-phosphate deacetylase n=1 Tax=Pseudonocardia sp. CA-107938 TaxID=3240021 RepID=UPI003D90127D
MTTLLTAGTVVAAGTAAPGWVAVDGDRITAVGHDAPPAADERRDLGADAVLVPGFVDQHVHGGAGAAFTGGDTAEALRAVRFHRAHGTTTTVASLVAAGPAELRRDVAALAELVADGELAGVHLEGPWLAAARCGAHDPAQLRDPDPAELAPLLASGVVRMVTLAPERAGGLAAIRQIAEAGVVAAVGHTDASYALTRKAIAAGARVGTHLFNAMAPVHHREPGPAIALMEDPRVVVELVTDGLHVHPALWTHVLAAAGADRVAAVTDAMAAAGMPDGDYHLGALRVTVADRVARVAGADGPGPIAGSTATTADLFALIVAHAEVPRADALLRAVAMTATTPARALGLAGEVGALEPGARADLVVLDAELRVREVHRAGRVVDAVPLAG